MPRDNDKNDETVRTSRRTVLKGTATAAVGLAGFTGSVAGFEGDDGDIVGPADFPRATTRGHFDIDWLYREELTDDHTKRDYRTVGEIPGYGSANPEEVVILVHGWLVAPHDAPDHFSYHEPGDGCMADVVGEFSSVTKERTRASQSFDLTQF